MASEKKSKPEPRIIASDRDQYEAFLLTTCFKDHDPALTYTDSLDTFTLETLLKIRKLNKLESVSEKVIDDLALKSGFIFRKEKEREWLEGINSLFKSGSIPDLEKAADLIYKISLLIRWRYHLFFLKEAATIVKILKEIEMRPYLSYLKGCLGLTEEVGIFQNKIPKIQKIAAVIARFAEVEKIWSRHPDKAVKRLKKLIPDARNILKDPWTGVPTDTLRYFQCKPNQRASQPKNYGHDSTGFWSDDYHSILSKDFRNAISKFRERTSFKTGSILRANSISPFYQENVWNSAFAQFMKSIETTTEYYRSTKAKKGFLLEKTDVSGGYRWFVDEKFMSSYFLEFYVKPVAKASQKELNISQDEFFFDDMESLASPEEDSFDPTEIRYDQKWTGLKTDENKKEIIGRIFDELLKLIDPLQELDDLENAILTEFFSMNEVIDRESAYWDVQNTYRKKNDLSSKGRTLREQKLKISDICKKTIDTSTGEPYPAECGYKAKDRLKAKIAQNHEILRYLRNKALKSLAEGGGNDIPDAILRIYNSIGLFLEKRIVVYFLKEIENPATPPLLKRYFKNGLERLKLICGWDTIQYLIKKIEDLKGKDEILESALLKILKNATLKSNEKVADKLIVEITEYKRAEGSAPTADLLLQTLGNMAFKGTPAVSMYLIEKVKSSPDENASSIREALMTALQSHQVRKSNIDAGLIGYWIDTANALEKTPENKRLRSILLSKIENSSFYGNKKILQLFIEKLAATKKGEDSLLEEVLIYRLKNLHLIPGPEVIEYLLEQLAKLYQEEATSGLKAALIHVLFNFKKIKGKPEMAALLTRVAKLVNKDSPPYIIAGLLQSVSGSFVHTFGKDFVIRSLIQTLKIFNRSQGNDIIKRAVTLHLKSLGLTKREIRLRFTSDSQ